MAGSMCWFLDGKPGEHHSGELERENAAAEAERIVRREHIGFVDARAGMLAWMASAGSGNVLLLLTNCPPGR